MTYYAYYEDTLDKEIRVHTIKSLINTLQKKSIVVGKIGPFIRLSNPPYKTRKFRIKTVIQKDYVITYLSLKGGDPVKLLTKSIEFGDDSGFDLTKNCALPHHLKLAVKHNRAYMVQTLLDFFNPTQEQFQIAYSSGFHHISVLLAQNGVRDNRSITSAIHINNPSTLESFLEYMEPDPIAYLVAIERNHIECFKILYKKYKLYIDIDFLLKNDKLDFIKYLDPVLFREHYNLAISYKSYKTAKWIITRIESSKRCLYFRNKKLT